MTCLSSSQLALILTLYFQLYLLQADSPSGGLCHLHGWPSEWGWSTSQSALALLHWLPIVQEGPDGPSHSLPVSTHRTWEVVGGPSCHFHPVWPHVSASQDPSGRWQARMLCSRASVQMECRHHFGGLCCLLPTPSSPSFHPDLSLHH